jgi:hypothetical protein
MNRDQRSLANRLAAAAEKAGEEQKRLDRIVDPRAAAQRHGNKPSKGAEIDAQLAEEDAQTLKGVNCL